MTEKLIFDAVMIERPRPDADLGKVKVTLDWKTIVLQCDDEAALGRVFMWLIGNVSAAGRLTRAADEKPPGSATPQA